MVIPNEAVAGTSNDDVAQGYAVNNYARPEGQVSGQTPAVKPRRASPAPGPQRGARPVRAAGRRGGPTRGAQLGGAPRVRRPLGGAGFVVASQRALCPNWVLGTDRSKT